MTKVKPFINQYKWKEISFLSDKKDCTKFQSDNKSIAINILFTLYDSQNIRHAKHQIINESIT